MNKELTGFRIKIGRLLSQRTLKRKHCQRDFGDSGEYCDVGESCDFGDSYDFGESCEFCESGVSCKSIESGSYDEFCDLMIFVFLF